MTDVFQGYERQYCEISASLSRKCTAAASQEGEKLKQKASEIKSGIDGAEALIRKMDLEAREARNRQPSVRAGQLAKLREYKSDLNNLKGALKRITAGNGQQGAREELLESGMADTLVLHDVDDNIGKSRKIMGAMVRRMDRNKWIIGLLIALLVLAILVVLYFKFVH
uniref:Vesicle transport v-SNARE 13 n=1 Tax=Aegilops tauschii TaxID=37682 RepID=N1QPK7_AEGTA